jgi:hypothetical protein
MRGEVPQDAGNASTGCHFKEETTMDTCVTTMRELTAGETELVGGGDFTWGGFVGHVAAGAVTGGLAGSIAPGVGTAAGALGGGLLGGISYSLAAAIEQMF